MEYSDIIIGLDNIFQRNDYSKCKNGNTIIDFSKKSKGNKIKDIDDIEPLSKLFNIKSNANELRNAIGHADYDYNGFLQTITYKKSFGSEEIVTSYLLDVAMECVNLARSLLIMLFCIYELKRTNYCVDFNTPMPKFMYSRVKGQGRCPCGSGKKYSSCCKNKKVFNYTLYPRRANCYFKVGPNGIELPEGLLEKFMQK